MIDLPPVPVPVVTDAAAIHGQFISKEITTKAGTRTYKLYVPASYDVSKPHPLVVMLHGCTQDADNIARGTRLNSIAEDKKVLVAYPEQPAGSNLMKCWNWYEPANQKRDEGEPSIIAAIAQEIISSYSVDRSRVYIAGVSAGAAMALTTAYAYPDLFAAVGSHSGIAYGAASSLTEGMAAMQRGAPPEAQLTDAASRLMGTRVRFLPAIVFQGSVDRVVNFSNTRNIVGQLTGLHPKSTTLSVSGEFKGTSNGGYHFTRFVYGSGNSVVEAWVVDELGHAWSGGSPDGTYTDPKGPDAAGEMLKFFLKHRLPKKSK